MQSRTAAGLELQFQPVSIVSEAVEGADQRQLIGRWTGVDFVHRRPVRKLCRVDGVHWPPAGRVCLPITDPDEHGFGRPWIVRDADRSRIFFSVRRRSVGAYRPAYAESLDGHTWRRADGFGLEVGAEGWDSDAITYPAVVDAGGRRFCFYNGNDFGRDGFGVAVLDAD